MFVASIVVPTFHINLRLNANTYQKEKQVKPGNSETKRFFFSEIWACWTGSTFKFSVFKALNLSSVIFMKPSTVTVVLRVNLH